MLEKTIFFVALLGYSSLSEMCGDKEYFFDKMVLSFGHNMN